MLALIAIASISRPIYATAFYAVENAKHARSYFYQVEDRFLKIHDIAAHRWSNNKQKLAVLSHGYLDNCAYFKPMVRWFLDQDYDVLCLELPGHGKSSGQRADISSMLVYEDVLLFTLPKIFELNYEEFVFFGHSTGNVGITEYLLNKQPHQFEHIVLAAPLIRSYMWDISVFTYRAFGGLFKRIPRRTLHDDKPEYTALTALDPHLIKSAPTTWFDALIDWNRNLENDDRVSSETITVFFAEQDTVIDTEYDRAFYAQHFPNADIIIIPGADHMLHYEEPPIRNAFFTQLKNALTVE